MLATRLAAETLRRLPRERLSRALGRVAAAPAPSPLLRGAINLYCRAYRVDMRECVVPEGGYRTFNEFFTRKLEAGARPVDPDHEVLVSPADGRVEACGPIESGSKLVVKGHAYSVAELLGDAAEAQALEGGIYAVVYLSPRDYHRVHAPIAGAVRWLRHVPGTLFPVNRIGLDHVPGLFARNERVVIMQEGQTHGRVATLMVGAFVVGGIDVAFEPTVTTNARAGEVERTLTYEGADAPVLERGDELGLFRLGSTAIVLAPPSSKLSLCVANGDAIRVGEALARSPRTRKAAQA